MLLTAAADQELPADPCGALAFIPGVPAAPLLTATQRPCVPFEQLPSHTVTGGLVNEKVFSNIIFSGTETFCFSI